MLQTYAEQFNQAREKAGTTPDTFAIDKYTALMKSAFGDVGVSMAEEAQALIAKGIPLPPMTPRDMMRAQGVGAGPPDALAGAGDDGDTACKAEADGIVGRGHGCFSFSEVEDEKGRWRLLGKREQLWES